MIEATLNSPKHARSSLESDLHAALLQPGDFPRVHQVELPADSLTWLAAQPHDVKLLWGDRAGQSFTAGLGAARTFTLGPQETTEAFIARCRASLQGLPEERLYGGFSFRRQTQRLEGAWADFGTGTFWLPRATVRERHLRLLLLSADDLPAAQAFVDQLVAPDTAPASRTLPPWLQREDLPERAGWTTCVERALGLFGAEVLEKIVLARRVDLRFAEPLDPIAVSTQLFAATPGCYHFCFAIGAQRAFLGATPERLFWRDGRLLRSEVVAGTRRRGSSPQEDERLAAELLASGKDQLEHDIVRKSIRQRLHAYVEHLEVDARAGLLRLASKLHLRSRVRAMLRDGVGDGELLDRLHPTPAVGGYPTENALSEIERLEPFDRGWYAAPVGWIGQNDAEFTVAIRSGLIDERWLRLYSGAGIVPGSRSDAEWDEVENKVSDFLRLFAGSTPAVPYA